MNDFLAAHYLLHWWLLACGALVTCVVLWFLSGILMEIARGFARACDFQTFKRKCGVQDGKPYVFRWRYFFGAWWHLTGFKPGDSVIEKRGHRWQGYKQHVILGKFVNEKPSEFDTDESDDD